MSIQHSVAAFLGRNNFDVRGPAVNTVIDALLYEMEAGLQADPVLPPNAGTALDMIPSWIMPPEQPPKNTSVIVIDAGGTNFRAGLVTFDNDGIPAVSHFERKPMPATEREYSKDEFFNTIASYLDHVKDKADAIGFCFSYPMKITPQGDGQVLQFSKEIKAPQVVGSLVGENLAAALEARGWKKPKKIMLLNDTAAALLAGASTAVKGKHYSSYAGFILGTGMNAAYLEYKPIPKVAGNNPLPMQIVVCESGKSNKTPRSRFDELFTKKTNAPDIGWFEKMCSGAYIGSVASIAVREAAADMLFSKTCTPRFTNMPDITLIDMDRFLTAPYNEETVLGMLLAGGTEDDRETLYRILDAFIARAARLAAANIAAAVIKTGKGSNPALPVCVLAEGTTFLKTRRLKDRVIGFLNTVLLEERGIYYDIVSLDHAVTFGTAIAGLSK
ncbi:MAG: hexokinase [Treponema sp.]